MKAKNFFEHLNVFFENEEDKEENDSAEITAFAYKNKKGKIEEIRIFNPKYDEFFYMNINGESGYINIEEEKK